MACVGIGSPTAQQWQLNRLPGLKQPQVQMATPRLYIFIIQQIYQQLGQDSDNGRYLGPKALCLDCCMKIFFFMTVWQAQDDCSVWPEMECSNQNINQGWVERLNGWTVRSTSDGPRDLIPQQDQKEICVVWHWPGHHFEGPFFVNIIYNYIII